MDRLLRLRQREARTSGRAVTSLVSLPSELVAKIVEYNERCGYRFDGVWDSWLGRYLTFACVSKTCLEALQYVSRLRINFPFAPIPQSAIAGTGRGTVLDAQYDAIVMRWCDIVSRRFRNVLRVENMSDVRKTMNPAQTVAIVDCVASFPHLQEFELWAGNAISASESIKAHLRAGRFQNLRCLRFHCKTSVGRVWTADLFWHVGQSSRLPVHLVKTAVRSLMSDLPVDLCLDVLLWGIYPRMALIDDELESWASMFFDLVARGADVHSRRILWEVARNFPVSGPAERLNVLCDMVEKLLVVHGADPNCMASDPYFYAFRTYKYLPPVLWEILDWLNFQHGIIVGDISIDSDDSDADIDNEQVVQVLMRIIDLLVRHGGRCSADDTPRGIYDKREDFFPWILSRADCTAAIRDAVNQGNLVY